MPERQFNPALAFGVLPNVVPVGDGGQPGDVDVPMWVHEMNSKHAVVVLPHAPVVLHADHGVLSIASFRQMHKGAFAPGVRSDQRPRPVADAWLDHRGRAQYSGGMGCFPPPLACPPSTYNMWRGFRVAPMAGDVAPWLDALAGVVPNADERGYLVKLLARKVQNPGEVLGVAPVIKGKKGSGKNALFEPLLKLFGRHGTTITNPDQVVGRFTGHLMDKPFVVVDEAVFAGDPRHDDRLKSLVTAERMSFESKGLTPIDGKNLAFYVILSNHEHVVVATADERRWVVVNCGEALRGNRAFWRNYFAWLSGDGPAHLLHYLLSLDLTGFDHRDIPRTEALRGQMQATTMRDPLVSWWHHCLAEGRVRHGDRAWTLNDDKDTELERAVLRMSFEASLRGRHGQGWAQASARLRKWCGGEGMRSVRKNKGGDRIFVDVLPSLAALREAFSNATGVQVDDPAD